MKFKLIVAAMSVSMASVVSASEAEVYGRMVMFQSSENVGTAGASHRVVNDASRIGIRFTETLSGGLTVRGVIETGVNSDDPTASGKETKLGDRESSISLVGDWGSIGIGRKAHPWATVFDTYTAMGRDYGSFDNAITSTYGTRFSNATFGTVNAGPVKLSGAYSAAESRVDGATANGGTSLTAEVGLGAASVVYGYHQTVETSAGQDKSHLVGARYTYAGESKPTVGVLFTNDNMSSVKSNSWQVFGSQFVTKSVQVAVGYGENDNGADGVAVRGTYFMSKRTRLMAVYSDANYTSSAKDTEIIALGIRHDF